MTESAKKFAKDLRTNDELRAKLEELIKSAEGKTEDEARAELIQPFLAMAKECGYDLTEEDISASKRELSEEELEAVAGGLKIPIKQIIDFGKWLLPLLLDEELEEEQ